jgi:hypothetical protein
LADGTADHLRRCFVRAKFGIGGLTTVDGGAPVSCLELMAELARLRADFCFLRNSFKRECADRDWSLEIKRIWKSWDSLNTRNAETVERQHKTFIATCGASSPRR